MDWMGRVFRNQGSGEIMDKNSLIISLKLFSKIQPAHLPIFTYTVQFCIFENIATKQIKKCRDLLSGRVLITGGFPIDIDEKIEEIPETNLITAGRIPMNALRWTGRRKIDMLSPTNHCYHLIANGTYVSRA